MVTILNKSNRPIGIAGQSVLPDKEIVVKDKLAYCDVCDENGAPTGEKQLLPGLRALIGMKFVEVREEPEQVKKPVAPVAPAADDADEGGEEDAPAAEDKPEKKRGGRKPKGE